MIEVSNFNKAYGSEIAVSRLSFSVNKGEVMGLIGPNGAGKTTTLRSLTGIVPASGGELSVNGFNVSSQPLELKQVTYYVPDDPQLFNDLTVEQHFEFTARVYNVVGWEDEMQNWLQRFALLEKINTRAGDLSRGMRQKLAISCAYLCQPMALLLDEPMTGLDPRGIRVLKDSIKEQAERGAAVIISSHLLAMVEDICSHVLILQEGQKKHHGRLDELQKQYGQSGKRLEDIFFQAVENEMAFESSSQEA